jgi:lysophospholipid acyltransferase
MVLTIKLTMFAWNAYDATRPTADLDKWQLEKRIATFPSLVEFFGFA